MFHATPSIVLRRIPYGEADQVVTFLCREQGRLSGLAKGTDLEKIFCLKYERQVKADNTFEGRTYQIVRNEYRISSARAKVEIRIILRKK